MPFRLAFACLLAFLLAALPARADEAMSPEQRRAIERTVRDYLLANPEILIEMSRALESRQKAKAQADAEARIAEARDALFASEYDHVVNPDGGVPVVEFFDYNCGFCKRAHPAIADLAATDPRARVIYKEFPILGEASVHAARAAIAAKMQGRYLALHDLMMTHRGNLDAATVKRLAGEAGLDVARMERDMADPRVDAELDRNMEVAARLDIRGTPTFIIGDQLVPGAIDRPTMGAMVSEAEQDCRVC